MAEGGRGRPNTLQTTTFGRENATTRARYECSPSTWFFSLSRALDSRLVARTEQLQHAGSFGSLRHRRYSTSGLFNSKKTAVFNRKTRLVLNTKRNESINRVIIAGSEKEPSPNTYRRECSQEYAARRPAAWTFCGGTIPASRHLWTMTTLTRGWTK